MKIRINQDVTFNWKLTVEGESVDLSKLELSVEITTPSNKKVEIIPTITFDILEFNYRPKQIGEYILSAYLNRFKDGETALDIKAFEGVRYSWNQDFSTDGNLEANYVELAGDFNFGPKLDIYTNITYSELVELRNNAQLTPGKLYRITDYTCTTTQANTRSAGHVFDIIVTADSTNTLNEVARAVQHVGDSYFTNNDLNAWKIWYCLDNDNTRFEWADATNGKGVIYRMIDEFNNDVPYDFKNIQYTRNWSTIAPKGKLTGSIYCYTFSIFLEGFIDGAIADDESVKAIECIKSVDMGHFGNNVIRMYQDFGVCSLNNIVLFTDWTTESVEHYSNTFENNCRTNTLGNNSYSNTFGPDCIDNTFGNGCYSNTFGYNCFYNIFSDSCYFNTFGNSCHDNNFDYSCQENTFGDGCYENNFGSSCKDNTFGNNCYSNTFGNSCSNNTIGNGCYSNTFNSYCSSNIFGVDCHNNTVGMEFYNNTFGNSCSNNTTNVDFMNNTFGNSCSNNSFGGEIFYNTFGPNCSYNTFGMDCSNNTFGTYCQYIKFASDSSASTKYDLYGYNHFGDGCQYIVFTGAGAIESSTNKVQNYNFAQGLQGTSSTYLTVNGERSRSYETKVAKNSAGDLKIYCEADSIQ